MNVNACLPPEVRGFSYVKNHHYVELTDEDGNTTRLNADRLFIGHCTNCTRKIPAYERRPDMVCPYCATRTLDFPWDSAQLAFLPGSPSNYKAPPQRTSLKDLGPEAFDSRMDAEETPTQPVNLPRKSNR